MRFVLMVEAQQGLSYGDHVAIAKRAEANGFDAFFRSDHYASFPGPPDQPTTDAWTVLAGLARDTDRIGLGVLVSPVTYRRPGSFAKVVTTVDEMSGGRIEVGVGAGWNDEEHAQLGIPFPPIAERADLLEEQLAILHGLWGGPDGWSFEGPSATIVDAMFRPKPVQVPGRPVMPSGIARPRIILGGGGTPRSLRLAARWADEFNTSSAGPARIAEVYAGLDAACQAIGRDPATMARSAMVGVLLGRDAEEVRTRERSLLEALGTPDAGEEWLEERRDRWVMGTPDEARAMIARLADIGVERVMLQDFLPRDMDMIDLMGEALVAQG